MSGNNSLCCRRLNLEDVTSINDFANDMIANEPQIDTLVNAAGVTDLPERELTKYGVEKQFWVNFLAPYLLTMRLTDKLKESAKETNDSRVVNIVGSPKNNWVIDINDLNFDTRKYKTKLAYQQSKMALAYFTILYNRIFYEKGVRSYGVSPPNMASIAAPLDHQEDTFLNYCRKLLSQWSSIPASSACGTTVLCAIDDKIIEGDSGGGLYKYLFETWGTRKGWGKLADNELDAQVLWNLAAKMLLQIPGAGQTAPSSSATSNKNK